MEFYLRDGRAEDAEQKGLVHFTLHGKRPIQV